LTRSSSHQEAAVSLSFGAILALAVGFPFAALSGELISAGFAEASATLSRPGPWLLLLRSSGLAVAITTVALLVGVPLGTLLARTDLPGRRLALWLQAFSFFVPPYLLALGWSHLIGRQGLIGSPLTAEILFGPLGVVFVLGLAFAPVVTGLVALGTLGVAPHLEESALVVARPLRVLLRIVLPLCRPSITFAALIVFALALSETGVPLFLRDRTYAAVVFSRLGGAGYAPGEAFALAIPMITIGLVLLSIERRFIGRRSFASLLLSSGGGKDRPVYSLGRSRPLVALALWLLVALSLAPLVALCAVAAGGDLSETLGWTGSSLTTTAASGLAGASCITLLAVVLGHGLARGRRGSGAFDGAALLAFVVPSAVLGAGIVAAWNRPQTSLVYASFAVLVVGLVARYAIVGLRAVAAVMLRTPVHTEEAAATLGGSYLRRLFQIVIPLHARGILAAWLLALLFCLRDLDTVVVFYPPGRESLTVRIFTLEANGPPAVVAGLGVVQVLMIALAMTFGLLLLRRRAWA